VYDRFARGAAVFAEGDEADRFLELMLFGETFRAARRRYVRALEGVQNADWRTSLPGGLPWWRREPDRPLDPPPPAAWVDEQGLSTGRDRQVVPAPEFLEHCAALLGVSVQQLARRGRDAPTSRLRFLIAGLLSSVGGSGRASWRRVWGGGRRRSGGGRSAAASCVSRTRTFQVRTSLSTSASPGSSSHDSSIAGGKAGDKSRLCWAGTPFGGNTTS